MLYQLSLILAAQIICIVPLFMNEDDDRTIKVQIAPGKRSRTLTLIYNVPEDRQTLLLQMLKKKMSCGGTINKEKKYLQLQGDFKENICDYLKQQFPEHNVVIGTGDIKGLTASPRDMPSGTASQIVTNPDESKKSHSGHKKTAFCIRDGILEKTDDDRLGAFIQDIKRKEKACCIFTFITFKSDKRNDLDDLIDDLKQFLKSFLEDDARSIYSEKLGMEVFWITEPNEEYEFLFTEGIDHLEAVYDKLHLLVLNQIYKIAYDIVRGEAISLLERALADIYDKRQEELTTKEMFIVEARKKVSDLIEALKGGCSLDISFEESPWKRCCRKEDPYFFETDFVKFEKTIGHKFLSCKKRFKKVVKQLICKKFREYVKGIVSDIIPAFLPILQEEDNIEDIVDYMFDVYNVVQRRMLEASSYDTHESVSEFTKDYIEMSSSSKIENNLKRTYKRDILPGLKRTFECRKTQFLDELKIVKITRIFSHSYEIADVNHKQLCEVLMNTSMCEESGGEPVLVNDENGKAFKEVGKLRSDGITEEEKKDIVLYGFTYDVMAQDSQELSAINTD